MPVCRLFSPSIQRLIALSILLSVVQVSRAETGVLERDDICSTAEIVAKKVSACAGAYYSGRWFAVDRQGSMQLTTTHGGSSFRLSVSKSSDVNVDIAISDVTKVSPRIAVYISENGGELKRSEFIDLDLIKSTTSYKIAKDLSPSSTYNIEVRVVGVSEFEDRWDNGGALSVASVRPSPGGSVAPWVDDRAKVLFIGDSIVEGVAAKKEQGSITRNSAGDEAFGTIAAQLLDMSVINNGYGGVGLLVPGSGGWPAVPESTGFYMRGLHVTGESPKVIVAMLGTNDKVPDEEFEAAYVLYMKQLKREYPDSKVIAMVPFSQRYSSAISSASKKAGVPLIETFGWGVSTTDGVHPDTSSNGHRLAGEKTAEAINKILGV